MNTFLTYTTTILITICGLDFMLFFWLSEVSSEILLISFLVFMLNMFSEGYKNEITN